MGVELGIIIFIQCARAHRATFMLHCICYFQFMMAASSSSASTVTTVEPAAASERVFSLPNNCFSKRQDSSLSDYVEASLMLQYNER